MTGNFYREWDVLKALFDMYYNSDEMGKSFIRNDLLKGISRYNGVEYPIANDSCYYDKVNDLSYYSESFYLQFLTIDILQHLAKYSIDQNGNVTPV